MKKVYVGVGHGGSDPGAVANGMKEKDLALDVAKACAEALKNNGVDVKISRESDISKDLSARIKECNAYKPDLAVDIHFNAGGGDGAEVYHAKNNTNDEALAQNILDELKTIGQNSRGLKTKTMSSGADYFGFIRQITCPSVLVECAFIDNKTDIAIADTDAERKTMGIAIAKGILKTLGITYTEKSNVKENTTQTTATTSKADSFLPARGYFKKGDTHANIGKIASFMRKTFPSYTNEKALGNYFGDNLYKSIKEFQRRTKLEPDGNIGPLTLAMLVKYGFKK